MSWASSPNSLLLGPTASEKPVPNLPNVCTSSPNSLLLGPTASTRVNQAVKARVPRVGWGWGWGWGEEVRVRDGSCTRTLRIMMPQKYYLEPYFVCISLSRSLSLSVSYSLARALSLRRVAVEQCPLESTQHCRCGEGSMRTWRWRGRQRRKQILAPGIGSHSGFQFLFFSTSVLQPIVDSTPHARLPSPAGPPLPLSVSLPPCLSLSSSLPAAP